MLARARRAIEKPGVAESPALDRVKEAARTLATALETESADVEALSDALSDALLDLI
jgi:hypothetical protein